MRPLYPIAAPLLALALVATIVQVPDTALAQASEALDENEPRPGESDADAAARINEEGKVLVQKGKYYEALEKFHAALNLFPISNAIFNVGSMLFTLKQYPEAFPYVEQTLKAPLAPEQRDIVLKYRAEVLEQTRLTHKDIMVRTNPPGAALTLNGKALPFPAPTRVLVPYGASDIGASYQGFKPTTAVVKSSSVNPPKDLVIRMEREEPYAVVSARCPTGSDVYIDGQMQGFELVRTRLLIGPHQVRCGKTARTKAFERPVEVRKGLGNAFDFSTVTE